MDPVRRPARTPDERGLAMMTMMESLIAGRQASWPMTMLSLMLGAAGAMLYGLSG
jgi:hypothetical protein